LASSSSAFLNPVFGNWTSLARFQGVVEAARRVHDDRIGIGRVFHLFRLPEVMEEQVFELLQQRETAARVIQHAESREAAVAALSGLVTRQAVAKPGPTRIGTMIDLGGDDWLSGVAAHYQAAFAAQTPCFPYFTDR
jgi:hypothetical protein